MMPTSGSAQTQFATIATSSAPIARIEVAASASTWT